jgi:hypothetical protein
LPDGFTPPSIAVSVGSGQLGAEDGQGTVEYVGLILPASLLMVGMVAAMKGFNTQPGRTSSIGTSL